MSSQELNHDRLAQAKERATNYLGGARTGSIRYGGARLVLEVRAAEVQAESELQDSVEMPNPAARGIDFWGPNIEAIRDENRELRRHFLQRRFGARYAENVFPTYLAAAADVADARLDYLGVRDAVEAVRRDLDQLASRPRSRRGLPGKKA